MYLGIDSRRSRKRWAPPSRQLSRAWSADGGKSVTSWRLSSARRAVSSKRKSPPPGRGFDGPPSRGKNVDEEPFPRLRLGRAIDLSHQEFLSQHNFPETRLGSSLGWGKAGSSERPFAGGS